MDRPLKKIGICNDVWVNIFPLVDRVQLGLGLAVLSVRFDSLVDSHFNGTALTIWRKIRIVRSPNGVGGVVQRKDDGSDELKIFPLPMHPLPKKITHFKEIIIDYVDHTVIKFLHDNMHIWNKGNCVGLSQSFMYDGASTERVWDVIADQIWPILAPNMRGFSFSSGGELLNLDRRIAPNFLFHLNNLRSIYSNIICPNPIFGDHQENDTGQMLAKWLHTPTADDKPKTLRCFSYHTIRSFAKMTYGFVQAFLNSTAAVSYEFLIDLDEPNTEMDGFELTNEKTEENLTLEKRSPFSFLFKRCKILTSSQQQKGEGTLQHSTCFFLWLQNNESVGPLSPPPTDESEALMA